MINKNVYKNKLFAYYWLSLNNSSEKKKSPWKIVRAWLIIISVEKKKKKAPKNSSGLSDNNYKKKKKSGKNLEWMEFQECIRKMLSLKVQSPTFDQGVTWKFCNSNKSSKILIWVQNTHLSQDFIPNTSRLFWSYIANKKQKTMYTANDGRLWKTENFRFGSKCWGNVAHDAKE